MLKTIKTITQNIPAVKTYQMLGSTPIWQACISLPLLIIAQQLYMDFYSSTGFVFLFFFTV